MTIIIYFSQWNTLSYYLYTHVLYFQFLLKISKIHRIAIFDVDIEYNVDIYFAQLESEGLFCMQYLMYENCIFAHKEVEDFYNENNILKGM